MATPNPSRASDTSVCGAALSALTCEAVLAEACFHLGDLCVIRLSELHPRHVVITIDRADFKVYRRNKREAGVPPA